MKIYILRTRRDSQIILTRTRSLFISDLYEHAKIATRFLLKITLKPLKIISRYKHNFFISSRLCQHQQYVSSLRQNDDEDEMKNSLQRYSEKNSEIIFFLIHMHIFYVKEKLSHFMHYIQQEFHTIILLLGNKLFQTLNIIFSYPLIKSLFIIFLIRFYFFGKFNFLFLITL